MKDYKYIFFTTYAYGEESLYELEFRTLFGKTPTNKILFSNKNFNPSRSVFIKERLEVLCRAWSLKELLAKIGELNLNLDGFRINHIRHEEEIHKWVLAIKSLRGDDFQINGRIELKKPKFLLGITEINGTWYFGNLAISMDHCKEHNEKPYSYSSSCGVRVARVMANLAIVNDFSKTVIDPCCGAGTVLLELLSIGAKTFGNEIREKVVKMANQNLKHFGYDLEVTNGDISQINDLYDVAILDIPYGLFTEIDSELQVHILRETYRIANRLILLTNRDLVNIVESVGFEIVDQGYVDKGKLRRHVLICQKVSNCL
ncbi:MAG: methyltransferase domain-containing protein [Anaerovoracaceae bacterium]